MQKERYTRVPKSHHLYTLYMISLRIELTLELSGIKGKAPTAYTRIKKEFKISGSRNSVLRQLTYLIEGRLITKGDNFVGT